METEKLSVEKSFELIAQTISEARSKFEENGFIYVFWGILITIASFSQFFLLKYEYYEINYYPYFLMPLGGIFTGYYFYKKEKGKTNQISMIMGMAWVSISTNIMLLAFIYGQYLRENLTPIILLLLGIGIFISGGSIKSKLLIISGIVINISAFICFWLDWNYHPLLMGIASIVAVLIPGIILMMKSKKRHV